MKSFNSETALLDYATAKGMSVENYGGLQGIIFKALNGAFWKGYSDCNGWHLNKGLK